MSQLSHKYDFALRRLHTAQREFLICPTYAARIKLKSLYEEVGAIEEMYADEFHEQEQERIRDQRLENERKASEREAREMLKQVEAIVGEKVVL